MRTNKATDRLGKLGIREYSTKLDQRYTDSPTFAEVSLNPIVLWFFEPVIIHAMTELRIFHLISPFYQCIESNYPERNLTICRFSMIFKIDLF